MHVDTKDNLKSVLPLLPESLQSILTETDREQLAARFKAAGAPDIIVALVRSGNLSTEETMQLANQMMSQANETQKQIWKQVLGSEEMSHVLKSQITKQWMLELPNVGRENQVEELYERIAKQTAKLTEALSGLAKENTPLAKSTTTLANNVEFMNQLNQAFTYTQLPLKMSNQNAHGELYVYSKKKNLAKHDGNVSALLHLEMDHLGTMDVYVTMQNQKVSTKFYLEKEEYLDFIGQHLSILNEKLEKKGYAITSEVLLSEKKVNVMQEIMEQDKNPNPLARYSFDVRA